MAYILIETALQVSVILFINYLPQGLMSTGMNVPKLDFMMPGFPRCGTTTLAYHLAEHPEIFITSPKEPGFFKPINYKKRQSWGDYARLFADARPRNIKGECTVNYTTSWPTELVDPGLIHEHYPGVKLIFQMRDPVERIASHWVNKTQQNYPKDIPIFDQCVTHYSMFINTSRYWNHISRWLRHFDSEQVLAVSLEGFKKDPKKSMKKVESFLGVENHEYSLKTKINTSNYVRRDSNFERYIKQNKFTYKAVKIAKKILPVGRLHRLLKSEKTVTWDEDTLKWVRKELDSDSRAALEYADLNPSYWPKMFPSESNRS